MRKFSQALSTTALALALSLGAAGTAAAQTSFAFGSLSAQTQDHVTVFIGGVGTLTGAAADLGLSPA